VSKKGRRFKNEEKWIMRGKIIEKQYKKQLFRDFWILVASSIKRN
jgi:hypothetical protein